MAKRDAEENFKKLLMNLLILPLPNITDNYSVENEAYGCKIGPALLQQPKYCTSQLIGSCSHISNGAKQKLVNTMKCLALL